MEKFVQSVIFIISVVWSIHLSMGFTNTKNDTYNSFAKEQGSIIKLNEPDLIMNKTKNTLNHGSSDVDQAQWNIDETNGDITSQDNHDNATLTSAKITSDEIYKYRQWYMDEKKAKTVASVAPISPTRILKRIKRGWIEEQKEKLYKNEEEHARENSRETRERSHEATCRSTCLGGWQAWGLCTERCGGHGTQKRVRSPVKSCGSGCPGEL